MADLTFKQALIIATIPSVIGIAATYYSKGVSDKQEVIQARMTERDLTHQEALKASTPTNQVFAHMIPVTNNTAWSNYYGCRTNKKETRLSCANNEKDQKMDLTPENSKKPC